MKSKMPKIIASLLTAFIVTLSFCIPAFAEEDAETVYIRTADDLLKLSENCRYDAWSEGKTIVLQNDISLSGIEFTPLASFGGTFEGGYHTITGLNVSGNYSPAGLFGTIESSGTVRCLNVEGGVTPGGSADLAGGIAGINCGLIESCSFTGTVNGEKRVGGIAGENRSTGIIRRSRASGGVFGKDRSGGIAGTNHGSIYGCSNRAYVNTHSIDPSISFDSIDLNFANGLSSLTSPDIYNLTVDSGGIAGFSDGEILSCRNYGSVGYQHVGYNLGGIAGRSSGHIANCTNEGSIHGRREIGGIAGMAEPYIKIDLSSDSIEQVREQLNALSGTINKAAGDAGSSSAVISARLTAIGDGVKGATDSAQALTDGLSDTIDAEIDEVNRGGEILAGSIDLLDGVTDDLKKVSSSLEDCASYISAAMNGAGGNAFTELQRALVSVQTADAILQAGIQSFENGVTMLASAAGNALTPAGLDMDAVSDAIDTMRSGLDIIINGRGSDAGGVYSYIQDTAEHLKNAAASAGGSSSDIRKAADAAEDAAGELSSAMRAADRLVNYLNAQEAIEFKKIGTDNDARSDALYDSMRGISDNLELLNQEVKTASDLLVSDVRLINNQFNSLMNTLLDMVEELEGGSVSSYIRDTSDEDIDAVIDGKILLCSNTGSVDGDYDAGGIAGSMMIYNALDPEGDELNVSSALQRHYELKCIIQDCRNEGSITGKRDNIASVCGNGMFGVITGCEGYGSAEASGNYAGGIAGYANNTVRRCWSKLSLSGEKYVGGIVGGTSEERSDLIVENCFSLPEVTHCSQYSGAVIGNGGGTLKGNRFVSSELAGAGTVSLKGKAEPVSYEAAIEDPELPLEFRHFTLSFSADGNTVKTVRFNYGDSFDTSVFPEIPAADGMYGYWDRSELNELCFDTIVNAVYEQQLSALGSAFTRSASRPAFFVEGAFDGSELFDAQPAVFDFSIENEGLVSILRSFRRDVQEQWALTLPDDGQSVHYVRYLPPEMSGGRLELYALQDGSWQRIEAEDFGSYQRFAVNGNSTELTVTAEVTPWWIWLLTAVFALSGLVLLLDLLIHKRKQNTSGKATGEEEKRKLEGVKKKKKIFRIIMAAIVLALGISMFVVIRLVPRISKSLELYNLLINYSQRSELDIEMDFNAMFGGQAFDTNVEMFTTECEGEKLSCVIWQDIPIYFCGDAIILENGKCYRSEDLLADYSQLFAHAASMYSAVNIDVSEQNGIRTYRAEAAGEDAKLLLSTLIPGTADRVSDTDVVDLSLVVSDGEMESLDIFWAGGDGFVRSTLSVMENAPERDIPMAVRSAISSKEYTNAEDMDADMGQLLQSLTELASRDPLSADVTLSANAGPVIFSEKLLWQRTDMYSRKLSMVSRRGSVLYFTDDAFCTDSGLAASYDSSSLAPENLLHMAYQAVLLGSFGVDESSSGVVYSVTLDSEAMDAFAAEIAPQAVSLGIRHESGTVEITLEDGDISKIEINCKGRVRVVNSEVNSGISARLEFSDEGAFRTPASEVLETLGLTAR